MDFILKLFALIISSSLVQSKETTKVWKSIKLNEKMIYDCVDIYKQPSLDHPLLRNHQIQMEPSFSLLKSKNQIKIKKYDKIINCPNGTVPILRNTKEYVANAQYFAEKHFNPLTVESHGTHFAGFRLQDESIYYGLSTFISIHDLNISRDQVSYAHLYVGSRVNMKDNFIQAGWMINPSLFGDGRTWSYGFWKGANGACYNTVCKGFIQVSKSDLLSGPLLPGPPKLRNLGISIQQDIKTGNWWVTDVEYKKPDIAIGYWPKELFDLIENGVKMVGAGGAVESSPSGKSPPMGNGHLPTDDDMESARVYGMYFLDSELKFWDADKSNLVKLFDSPNTCYGLKWGKKNLFTFGGPGGDSCGI